jgi:hypothetical protein
VPRIQTFISNPILEKINDIVDEKIQEGASPQEASRSGITAMLIELGLRVYTLQRERQEGGFSQAEYNKTMLQNMMKVSFMCSKILDINSRNTEVADMPEFVWPVMINDIRTRADEVVEVFFPASDEE